MKRLCVVIDESREERKKLLHDVLAAYAVARDTEVEIRWLKAGAEDGEICSACVEAQLAFVSARDLERAARIGRLLYHTSPDCTLAYYGYEAPETARELTDYFTRLIPARPLLYLDRPGERDYYRAVQAAAEREALEERFFWETKGMQYRIPCRAILYFRSERNRVVLRLRNGREHAFPGKLSHVEERLPPGLFVRVHQSYLVNRREIRLVDKGRKTVELSSGEELYISKAHYRDALEY